jgi:membrane protease YdiL (CAAX protease family)
MPGSSPQSSRWQRLRARGKTHFVLSFGLLFAVPIAAAVAGLLHLTNAVSEPFLMTWLTAGLVTVPLGIGLGWMTWRAGGRRFGEEKN